MKNENAQVKLSDFKMNQQNPFAQQTLIKLGECIVSRAVKGTNNDDQAIARVIDGDGGLIGQTSFWANKVVDEEQFTKFYLAGFSAFFGLRPASMKVFRFIMELLKPNRDDFMFFTAECRQSTGLGVTTIYRALGDLCKAEIIARGRTEEEYFINPMVCFNGDRVTFATTYINKHHPNYQTKQRELRGTLKQMQVEGELEDPRETHIDCERKQLTLDDAFEKGKEA